MTLSEEVAVEVMGWEKTEQKIVDGFGEDYGFIEHWQIIDEKGNELPQFEVREFRPDSDLNQADMVKRKGIEVLMELAPPTHSAQDGHRRYFAMTEIDVQLKQIMDEARVDYIWLATAEQICQAVLMAVREARK